MTRTKATANEQLIHITTGSKLMALRDDGGETVTCMVEVCKRFALPLDQFKTERLVLGGGTQSYAGPGDVLEFPVADLVRVRLEECSQCHGVGRVLEPITKAKEGKRSLHAEGPKDAPDAIRRALNVLVDPDLRWLVREFLGDALEFLGEEKGDT